MKKLKRKKINEQIAEFLCSATKSDKLVIIYDDDTDGVISAALAKLALEKMNIPLSDTKVVRQPIRKFLHRVKGSRRLIILDYPYAYDVKYPKQHVLIIDHHPPKKLTKNVLILNPIFERKIYQPTSYLVYKLFSRLVNLKEKEWLAVVGTVGDYGFKDCMDLLSLYIKTRDVSKLWKNKYGKAAMMLNSAIDQIGFENTLKLILNLGSIQELLRNKRLKIAHEKFERKMKNGKREFWKNAEYHGKIIFSVLSEKYDMIGGVLSSSISSEHRDKIIFLILKRKNRYAVHGRYQEGKIDIGKLLGKFCDIRGGGHRKAGGGSTKDVNKFKEKILKELASFSR